MADEELVIQHTGVAPATEALATPVTPEAPATAMSPDTVVSVANMSTTEAPKSTPPKQPATYPLPTSAVSQMTPPPPPTE